MHWFIDPIKNHYFDFEGRATRQQFWMFFLIYLIVAIVIGVVESMVGLEDILTGLFGVALLLPYLGLAARRLHDIDKSGWWLLIGLVPIIGFIVLLVFYIKKGDAGENQYGPSPLGPEAAAPTPGGEAPAESAPMANDMPPQQPPSEDNQSQ